MTPPHPDASGMIDHFLVIATKSPLRPRLVSLTVEQDGPTLTLRAWVRERGQAVTVDVTLGQA